VANQWSITWRKIALTAVAAAGFAWFWINGPLQEPAPVFKFEEHVTGFDEPVRVGEERLAPKFALTGAVERHLYFHVMSPRDEPLPNAGIIGDRRSNPGLIQEVADQVMARAIETASGNPDNVTLKVGLDLFYGEERDAAGRPVRLYLVNTGLNKNIKGYAGPIDIGVAIDTNGEIRLVEHLYSMETTSYLRDIENNGFYERFEGIPLDGESHVVDAVSGATLTSEAIARSLSDLVSISRDSPLGIYLDTEPTGFEVDAVLPNTWIVDAALIALLFVIAWSRRLRASAKLSLGFSIVTVVYLGFWLNNSFTYVTFTQPFLGISWSYVLGVYAALVLLGAIWSGNSYCRYVCPYGNVQRLLVRFVPWHGKLRVSNRMLEVLRWLITLALVGGIAAGLRDWGSYELFPDLFGLEVASSPWFWLSVGIVLVSAYYPMLWCRALCPTGAVLDGVATLCRSRPGRAAGKSPARDTAAAA